MVALHELFHFICFILFFECDIKTYTKYEKQWKHKKHKYYGITEVHELLTTAIEEATEELVNNLQLQNFKHFLWKCILCERDLQLRKLWKDGIRRKTSWKPFKY